MSLLNGEEAHGREYLSKRKCVSASEFDKS